MTEMGKEFCAFMQNLVLFPLVGIDKQYKVFLKSYSLKKIFLLISNNPNRIKTRSKNKSFTRRIIPALIKKKFTITAEIV